MADWIITCVVRSELRSLPDLSFTIHVNETEDTADRQDQKSYTPGIGRRDGQRGFIKDICRTAVVGGPTAPVFVCCCATIELYSYDAQKGANGSTCRLFPLKSLSPFAVFAFGSILSKSSRSFLGTNR